MMVYVYVVSLRGSHLIMGKYSRANCKDEGGDVESDEQQARLGDLSVLAPEALLDLLQHVGEEDVEPLAHTLEHHDTQRDAGDGVEHTEDLAAHSLGCAMAVP